MRNLAHLTIKVDVEGEYAELLNFDDALEEFFIHYDNEAIPTITWVSEFKYKWGRER
jgi:hypothetical protein